MNRPQNLDSLTTSSLYARVALDAHALIQRVAAASEILFDKKMRTRVRLEHLRHAQQKADRIAEALRELAARVEAGVL